MKRTLENQAKKDIRTIGRALERVGRKTRKEGTRAGRRIRKAIRG